MIKIYLAGPYRAPKFWQIVQNVMIAWEYAVKIINRFKDKKVFPVTPHLMTAFMDGCAPDEFFLEMDMQKCSPKE